MLDWNLIRQQITALGVLGQYTTPVGQVLPAICLDSQSSPPPGVTVTGLEVVLSPFEAITNKMTLTGYEYEYRGRCILRQFDPTQGVLDALRKITPLFDRVEIGARVIPTVGFAEIETISFTFRYVEVFNE